MVAALTIASLWFGFFSVYLFAAHKLPFYKESAGKKVISLPMTWLAIGAALAGVYIAIISDPLMLEIFNRLDIENTGIADMNVQNASLLLTVAVGTPLVIMYKMLYGLAIKVESDKENKKYFAWSGILMAFLSALCGTFAVLLEVFSNT